MAPLEVVTISDKDCNSRDCSSARADGKGLMTVGDKVSRVKRLGWAFNVTPVESRDLRLMSKPESMRWMLTE